MRYGRSRSEPWRGRPCHIRVDPHPLASQKLGMDPTVTRFGVTCVCRFRVCPSVTTSSLTAVLELERRRADELRGEGDHWWQLATQRSGFLVVKTWAMTKRMVKLLLPEFACA